MQFHNSWDEILKDEFTQDYYLALQAFLQQERASHTIYPPQEDVFRTLHETPYEAVKVVILGQDPYHGEGQGHGLSFSVQLGVKIPPSLRNMYKELVADPAIDFHTPNNGYLLPWAQQGVLMLNAVLTVREGQANSHKGKGWEIFTDHVIAALNRRTEPVIFLLWGKFAQSKAALITNPQHVILNAAHPSPLSAHNGFFGCNHFSQTNTQLAAWGKAPINWQIDDI